MKNKKIEDVVNFLLGQGRLNIRGRIYRLIFFICIALMIFFSIVTFLGIHNSKDFAVDISHSIGNEALEKSSNILRDQKQKDLLYKIEERTKYIESELHDIYNDIILLKRELDKIQQNPEEFRPRPVRLGRDFREGDLSALRYAPFVNVNDLTRDPLRHEIETLGNLQDLFYFLSLKYRNPNFFDAPTFGILTESGIGIMADSAVTLEQWHNSNDSADFWSSSLYKETKKAWQEGKRQEPIYTSTYSEGINRNLGLFSCSQPYEIDGKFAGILFFSILIEELDYLVEPANMNNESINFILNDEGKVLLSSNKTDLSELDDFKVIYENPPDIRQSQHQGISDIAKKMTAGERAIEEIVINGNLYYIAYAPINGLKWSLGVLLPVKEVTEIVQENKNVIKELTEEKVSELDHRFFIVVSLMITFSLILWVIVAGISKKWANEFVEPIQELSDSVRDIASGNLDKRIDIKTGDEIEHLAVCFNAMTYELKNYMSNLTKITAEKERIATELNVAKDIQISVLPKDFNFNRKDFEIFATMNAAKAVGGDFYDFYMLDEYHLVVTMADVSGKGVPAALFMMRAKTILKNFATMMTNPDDFAAVMKLANDQLCQNNDAMMFVTVFLGMLNLQNGEFTFVNGGHNPPLVYHKAEDKFEYMKVAKNFVLGGMEDLDFVQQKIQLEKGDLIYLYTDGVTEALNPTNELYGEKRLIDCLDSSDKNISAEELLKFVRADVKKHVNGADQSDDITMMAVKFY